MLRLQLVIHRFDLHAVTYFWKSIAYISREAVPRKYNVLRVIASVWYRLDRELGSEFFAQTVDAALFDTSFSSDDEDEQGEAQHKTWQIIERVLHTYKQQPAGFLLRTIFTTALFIASVPIGLILSIPIWLFSLFTYVLFMGRDVDSLFEQVMSGYVHLSNRHEAKKLLQEWVRNEKAPNLFEYRPLLRSLAGASLRKKVAEAYRDAHTWWYEIVAEI